MRCYRLAASDGGSLPAHAWLKIGAIVRVPRSDILLPGAQWNPDEQAWVMPIWTECPDPTEDRP